MVVPVDVRAVRAFQEWTDGGNGLGACTDCLRTLLEGRADYLGAKDPTRWRRGDARALLYQLAVPRLSEQCDLTAHAVPTIDAYLDFLDRTDRLHPGSAAVRYLRQELAHHAAGFPAAMADRSRFRMAKILYRAMLADGVDIADDEAVDDWTAGFNRAPEADRAAVLEPLLVNQPELRTARFAAREGQVAALAPGQDPFDSRTLLPRERRLPDVMPAFAPVDVPSRAGAADAARRSDLLADLLTLARWIGLGRKVTKDGEPVPADVRALAELLGHGLPAGKVSHLYQVPSVQVLFWLARQLELVDLRRTGLVAGPELATWHSDDALATAADTDVLDLWQEVFALIEVGQQVPEEAMTGKNADSAGIFMASQGHVPAMLVALYGTAARDGDELVFDLIESHVEDLLGSVPIELVDADETELVDASLRFALCLPLDELIDHGALQLCGPEAEEFTAASTCTDWGLPVRTTLMAASSEIRIRLTPLGRWGLREALIAEGAEAPSAVPDPPAMPDEGRADVVDLAAAQAPVVAGPGRGA